MTSRDFVYWLQGFIEINEPKEIKEKQLEIIKRHLNMVFEHEIDPSMGDKEHQQKLNSIHNPLSRPSLPPYTTFDPEGVTLIRC